MMVRPLKKRMTGILAGLLAMVLVAAFMPLVSEPAYATEGDPAMTLGTEALSKGANSADAQTVHYGEFDWYVIAFDGKVSSEGPTVEGTADLYPEGTVTLLSKDLIDEEKFDTSWQARNAYGHENCLLKQRIDRVINDLSDGEQEAVYKRTLEGGGQNYGLGDPASNLISGASVTDASFWPLSSAEANVLAADLRSAEFNGETETWWLRSPGNGDYKVAYVGADGALGLEGLQTNSAWTYVRPAFFLDAGKVLFTSAAASGKESGSGSADALMLQSDKTNAGNEWKVTVKDAAHASFTIDSGNIIYAGDNSSVTVSYSGAAVGEKEYISAIITDKPVSEKDAQIKYYGRMAAASDDAGASVTINIAGKMGDNDRLYVFNEQFNGENFTDYASELQEVPMRTAPPEPVSIEGAKVVLSPTKFTYNKKVQKPAIKTIGGKKLTEGTDYTVKWSNASSKKAGTYKVTITGIGKYSGTATAKYTIKKADNPMTLKAKTAEVKYSKLVTNNQKVKRINAFSVKKAQGTKTYTFKSATKGKKKFNDSFQVDKKTGKITVKKGLSKGKYRVTVQVQAKGNSNYKASKLKEVTFTVRVK